MSSNFRKIKALKVLTAVLGVDRHEKYEFSRGFGQSLTVEIHVDPDSKFTTQDVKSLENYINNFQIKRGIGVGIDFKTDHLLKALDKESLKAIKQESLIKSFDAGYSVAAATLKGVASPTSPDDVATVGYLRQQTLAPEKFRVKSVSSDTSIYVQPSPHIQAGDVFMIGGGGGGSSAQISNVGHVGTVVGVDRSGSSGDKTVTVAIDGTRGLFQMREDDIQLKPLNTLDFDNLSSEMLMTMKKQIDEKITKAFAIPPEKLTDKKPGVWDSVSGFELEY